MLSPNGLERGTGIARLPEADRYNDEFLKTRKGLPWDAKPRHREAPGVVDAGVGAGAAAIEPRAPREEQKPRRRYITMAEVERYGGTDSFAACTRMALRNLGATRMQGTILRAMA